jgi:hypothetical protein
VKKDNLKKEIDAIEGRVADDIREALHALRSIGNIGAHPQPEETYIAQQDRDEKIARMKSIAAAKERASTIAPPNDAT